MLFDDNDSKPVAILADREMGSIKGSRNAVRPPESAMASSLGTVSVEELRKRYDTPLKGSRASFVNSSRKRWVATCTITRRKPRYALPRPRGRRLMIRSRSRRTRLAAFFCGSVLSSQASIRSVQRRSSLWSSAHNRR